MSATGETGRVESDQTHSLISRDAATKSGNDSVSKRGQKSERKGGHRGYITQTRLQAIREQLNRRQWAILEDVGRLGVVTGGQIHRVHYATTTAASRRARADLAEMVRLGVLGRLGRSIGGVRAGSVGWIYSLDVAGQRLLNPRSSYYRRPWTPTITHLAHALAVSELYVQLREAEQRGVIKLDTYDTEPACWRPIGMGQARLKPDAFVVLQFDDFEDRIFVEIDRDTEPLTRIASKARIYVRYWQSGKEQARTGVFPLVLWVAPTTGRQEKLIDALTSLPAEHWSLFMVTTTAQATEQIVNGETEPLTIERRDT